MYSVPPKRQRGERAGLTREQVLDAALDLVDEAGLPSLTMRALGARLGVEAMTLYHYVPNKDALIDGMVERVFTAASPPASPRGDWRTYLRTYAHDLRRVLLLHPGVLPAVVRPAVTPATLDSVETGLRMLRWAGFPLGMAVDALNSLTLFVLGHTGAEVGISSASGAGSPDWLAGLDESRYPLLLESVRTAAGTDDAARFTFAVESLLAGFAAQLAAA
ncbi:TetR/AcrR family transcriptional regulator C-terminal domain-containing protein [Dactylosporangium darangshiense]|uniref:TetR/AcrR family transcriptional regulator C-terminal domain-containing protein n=1 Tax=Dactylosporangium darangshiense TaxID=579108 RepID=A0ABP8DIS7_9ACTN